MTYIILNSGRDNDNVSLLTYSQVLEKAEVWESLLQGSERKQEGSVYALLSIDIVEKIFILVEQYKH